MPALLSRQSESAPDWAVICLCAAWCRTCDSYRPDLAELAAREQGVRFVWLDVEDDAEWLGDFDIETFPTLLVLARETPVFLAALPPQIGVFERTLRALRAGELRAATLDATAAGAVRLISERLAQWNR
jgi:thioredoxin 1